MARRDYGSKRRPVRSRSNAPRQFLLIVTSFLCGYLTATVFDFTSLSTWVNKHILAKNTLPEARPVAHKAVVPKPKFEFYTLLSKDNSAPVVAANRGIAATPIPKIETRQSATDNQTPRAAIAAATQQTAQKNVSVAESKPLMPMRPSSKETYMVQIASFNKRQDAEHLKASLVLRGFDVTVAPVAQHNMTWFRVIIGPFGSRQDAERAHAIVARNEHMKGMIRRMDG